MINVFETQNICELLANRPITRLDYCNSLLAGCTKQTLDKLRRVLNCSARVIFGGDSRHHVTPLLRDHLHWLRARERISFKLGILVNKALRGLAPCYRNEMRTPVSTLSTFQSSVPLLMVIWSYPEQSYNSATGHFVWLVRLPGTVYHWTFVQHLHYQLSKNAQDIFSHVPTSVTNCLQSTSSEHCMAPL